jgi:hypothetical protein
MVYLLQVRLPTFHIRDWAAMKPPANKDSLPINSDNPAPRDRPSSHPESPEDATTALRIEAPVRFTVGGPVMQVRSIHRGAVRCTLIEFGCEQFGYFRSFLLVPVVDGEPNPDATN